MVDPDEPRPRAGLIKPYYERGAASVVDNVTVKVPTKFPSAAFGGFMAADYNKIFPKHVYAPAPDGQGKNPNKTEDIIGSGPFIMETFKKDVVGEFRRFDNYFKKDSNGIQMPYLDGIDKFLIVDRGTLAAAVRTGRILFSCGEPHLEVDSLLALEEEMGGNLKLYFDLPGIYSGIWINTKELPWSDVRDAQSASSSHRPARTHRRHRSGRFGDTGGSFATGFLVWEITRRPPQPPWLETAQRRRPCRSTEAGRGGYEGRGAEIPL